MNPKICESCGAEFSCGAQAGPCWCEGIKLDGGMLAMLRMRYTDCLCPQCLTAMVEQQKDGPRGADTQP